MNFNELPPIRERRKISHIIRPSAKNRKVGSGIYLGPSTSTTKSSHPASIKWGKSPLVNSTSKSTSITKTSTCESDSRIILALTQGRGATSCEVGMAVIEIYESTLILSQLSDSQSYAKTLAKINILSPTEILVPMTFLGKENQLLDKIKNKFPKIKVVGVLRKTFNKTDGLHLIKQFCLAELNSILLILRYKYYAVSAACALLTFCQDRLNVFFGSETLKVEYQEAEGYALIDVSTADNLELVASMCPALANKQSTLFGVLNHCYTNIGSKFLRASILQPLYDVNMLNDRLNCVTQLVSNPEMLTSIQAILQKVPNIHSLLNITSLLNDNPRSYTNRHLNYVLLIKNLMGIIEPLTDLLESCKQKFFVNFKKILQSNDFQEIQKMLNDTIHPSAQQAKGTSGETQRCFAVKSGINGFLDFVRRLLTEKLEDIKNHVTYLSKKYNMTLSLGNNNMKGFHIILPMTKSQRWTMKKTDLPSEFVHVERLSTCFTFKTYELLSLAARAEEIMEDLVLLSNDVIADLLKNLKSYLILFHKLVENIAYLDMIQSLAQASLSHTYVRPKFATNTEVIDGIHPMLDFNSPKKFVPNNIISSADYNVHLITGPNGAGKSIYIRQVLLLQVMAQVGSYVPARSAIFRPADKIFARVYLEDDMECCLSTFGLEIKEMHHIMTTMTDNSLIIIDELMRSTSYEEGSALALAIIEKLLKFKAFIYVTTHYMLLTKLEDLYFNIKNYHMETDTKQLEKGTKLEYKYKLLPGPNKIEGYGLFMVQGIWPDKFMKNVYEVLNKVERKPWNIDITPLNPKLKLRYDTEAKVRSLQERNKLSSDEFEKIMSDYNQQLFKMPNMEVDNVKKDNNQYNENMDDNNILEISNLSEDFNASKFSLSSVDIQNLNPEVQLVEYGNNSYIDLNEGTNKNFSIEDDISSIRNVTNVSNNSKVTILENNITKDMTDAELSELRKEVAICSISFDNDEEFETTNNENSFIKKSETEISILSSANLENPNEVQNKNLYCSPKVKILVGPNNKSISFGEEDSPFKGNTNYNLKNNDKMYSNINDNLEKCQMSLSKINILFNEVIENDLQKCRAIKEFLNQPKRIDPTSENYENVQLEQKLDSNDKLYSKTDCQSVSKTDQLSTDNITGFNQLIDEETYFNYKQSEYTKTTSGYQPSMEEDSKNAFFCNGQTDENIHNESSSNFIDKSCAESNKTKSSNWENNFETSVKTSKISKTCFDEKSSTKSSSLSSNLSSISKKRNLNNILKNVSSSSNEKNVKNTSSEINSDVKAVTGSTLKEGNDNIIRKKKRIPFKPPLKKSLSNKKINELSKKELREDFSEQRERMMKSDPNSVQFKRYLQELSNRPTIRQIRDAEHIVSYRRNEFGKFQEVYSQKKCSSRKRKSDIMTRSYSTNSIVDVTVFSDRNSEHFEQFMKSKEHDMSLLFNTKSKLKKRKPNFVFNPYKTQSYSDFLFENSKTATKTSKIVETTITKSTYYSIHTFQSSDDNFSDLE